MSTPPCRGNGQEQAEMLLLLMTTAHWIMYTAHTVKKLIENSLSRLKSASLMIKNTISSLGIFLANHSILFTSYTANKYSNQSDGWKSSDIWWKTAHIFFDWNFRQFLETFWCQRKKFSTPSPLTGSQPPFWKRTGEKQVTPNSEKEINIWIHKKKEVRRRNKQKKKQNVKDNKRKRHIFVITGIFGDILHSKLCLLDKRKSLFSPRLQLSLCEFMKEYDGFGYWALPAFPVRKRILQNVVEWDIKNLLSLSCLFIH